MSGQVHKKIPGDLTAAMKSRDSVRTNVLRGLKSELMYKEIDVGRDLSDEECVGVIRAAVRKRQDAIDAFKKAGRADRAAEEEKELAVIKEYLPQELSADELGELIDEVIAEVNASGPKDFGAVMKGAMAKVAGRAAGKAVAAAVKAKLQEKPVQFMLMRNGRLRQDVHIRFRS